MRNSIYLIVTFLVTLLIGCESNSQGEKMYITHCSGCHGKNGEGLQKLIPPIANSDFLKANRYKLPCIIRNGINDTIVVNGTTYYQQMPENLKLKSSDIVNLVNYINEKWYKENQEDKPYDIVEKLNECQKR